MNPKPQIVVPGREATIPTHEMVSQMYSGIPQMMGQVMQVNKMQNAQLEQMMNIMLEHTILIRHMAKSMNIEVPSPSEVRALINKDRIAFLNSVLESDSSEVTEDMKDRIRKELVAMEVGKIDSKESVSTGPGADQEVS